MIFVDFNFYIGSFFRQTLRLDLRTSKTICVA